MTPDITQTILIFLKVCVLIGISLYTIFAIIVVRQEQLMAHVLEESFEPILRLLATLHLAASIGVLILAIVLL